MRNPWIAELCLILFSSGNLSAIITYKMFFYSRTASFFVIIVNLCIFSNYRTYAATGYCAIRSCKARQHTMCLFPNRDPSSDCNGYVAAPLTKAEKAALVDKHNKMRNYVAGGREMRGSPGPQPPAGDMKMLKWDNELAKVAQRWADQCSSGHDKCRKVGRFSVGQNIATVWSTDKINRNIETLMDGWYEEVKLFNREWAARYQFNKTWGHYSQLVWANTLYVGCARVRFWDNKRRRNTLRLVCNYGPAGNIRNKQMYASGHSRE